MSIFAPGGEFSSIITSSNNVEATKVIDHAVASSRYGPNTTISVQFLRKRDYVRVYRPERSHVTDDRRICDSIYAITNPSVICNLRAPYSGG